MGTGAGLIVLLSTFLDLNKKINPLDLIGMGLPMRGSIPQGSLVVGVGGVLDDTRLRELRRRRNLLILLVGHEIERIAVWNNPLNRLSLQIAESLKFKYETLPKSLKCAWKDCIRSLLYFNAYSSFVPSSHFLLGC